MDSYGGPNSLDEKRLMEKSKSLLNWLTQRNFDKIKHEVVKTTRASPTTFILKSLVCCIFDMAMVDNAYVLFSSLCVELFHELPPSRSDGKITTFERLFLCRCRMELENSSPKTDRPPLVYVEESTCLRFFKTVRVLAEIFKNRKVTETTRRSIIQVLMDPIFPPERNTDAMNIFLSSIGKLADFKFCDESFKQLSQISRAVELEKRYNEEVKLKKEAEDSLERKNEELDTMKRLLESYKEEISELHLRGQALEQKNQEELRLKKEIEDAFALELEKTDKVKTKLETLVNKLGDMCLKAEELESKYKNEVILRKEAEIALDKERNELEETKKLLETCKVEQENLTSQVFTLQNKYREESRLRKETEDALTRENEELEIVKGLLEAYNREADAMREERDNALNTVQELTRKQTEEREPPLSFVCPISQESHIFTMIYITCTTLKLNDLIGYFLLQEVMKDPHMAADGFTYEAEAIRRWLSIRDISPMTNLKLPHIALVPNRALRSAIEELV